MLRTHTLPHIKNLDTCGQWNVGKRAQYIAQGKRQVRLFFCVFCAEPRTKWRLRDMPLWWKNSLSEYPHSLTHFCCLHPTHTPITFYPYLYAIPHTPSRNPYTYQTFRHIMWVSNTVEDVKYKMVNTRDALLACMCTSMRLAAPRPTSEKRSVKIRVKG
jgi:hypothetical protein